MGNPQKEAVQSCPYQVGKEGVTVPFFSQRTLPGDTSEHGQHDGIPVFPLGAIMTSFVMQFHLSFSFLCILTFCCYLDFKAVLTFSEK